LSRPLSSSAKPHAWRYAACYALFLVVLGLSVLDFVIWWQALLVLVGVGITAPEIGPAVWAVGIVLVGLAMFALVMVAEPYLRAGVRRQQLGRRFVRLAAIVVVVGALGLFIEEVILRLG
jgi:hypothetical protein